MKKNEIYIRKNELIASQKYEFRSVEFALKRGDGEVQELKRDVFERGNGAVILLYNLDTRSVVLTRQFRLPTYLNGNEDGMLIEAAAGMLEDKNPGERIKMEVEEETGYRVSDVEKVLEAYMSPGAVTEILHHFVASYSSDMKKGEGGGLKEEGEDIEVLEVPFEEAYAWIKSGEIRDAKTIILLQYARIHIF